jgi:type IV secretory pathway TrbF-like protein
MSVPADEVADAMGAGQKAMRWWRLLALAQVPLIAIFGGGWLFELYRDPQVVPRIFWVDNDNMRVLAEASVDNAPDREAIYGAVGRLWVWNIRSRAPHPVVNAAFEREAQKLSDQKAWRQIAAMIEQLKKEHGCTEHECQSGVEVAGVITAQVDEIRQDTAGNEFAIVDVSWRERKFGKDGGTGPVFGFTAKLHIMAKAPPRTGEMPPNPFGLYVMSYRFDRTGPANQLAEGPQ